MAEFLDDPSVLTKDKLKSALLANNVALPNGEQRKGVYVDLYLKNLTSQNKKSGSVETFSSDEELAAPTTTTSTTTSTTSSSKTRSARKVTRKTDRHGLEEIDVTELSNEDLKDLLLKYGVNPGPIVASTRKLYERKLQRLLDQGPPETVVLVTETVETRSADSDQYSDKEEDTAVVPEPELEHEPEPEPEPEPVPVVEWPIRSRGKTPVTTRTRSTQHMEDEDEQEEDFRALSVQRKSRRSSRRLHQPFPATDEPDFSKLSASEMLAPSKERNLLAIPKEPKPLLADEVPASFSITEGSSSKSPKYPIATVCPALDELHEAISVDKIYEKVHLSMKSRSSQRTPSSFQHGKKLSGSSTAAHFTAAPDEEPQSFLKSTALPEESKSKTSSKLMKQSVQPCSTSPQLFKDLIHTMCRLSPSPVSQSKESPNSTFLVDSPYHPMQDLPVTKSLSEECSGSSAALSWGKQTKIQRFLSPITHVRGQDDAFIEERRLGLIEKLTAVEQTPKTPQKDVLKEMFLYETPSTPTGISATRRPPIKGAAGRPFSDEWLDNLRLRHTEVKHTSSSYTESQSVPRINAVPLLASKPAAPPNVPAKTRHHLPVWVQLLLLSAVAGFLFFIYQAMESNELSPFVGSDSSRALDSGSK